MGSSQAETLVDEKRNYLVFAIIGFLSIPVLFYFDTPIWQAARDLVEPDFLYIPEFFTHYGLYFFYLVFAVYGGYAFITRDRKRLKFCLAYIKAQLIFSLVIVRVLKTVLGRSRPGYGSDFNFFEIGFKYNAFPSGHSADAFVSALFLFFLFKHSKYDRYRFLPLIYASMIAVSRVFVSSHYPSDVAAGIAIGSLGAWLFISRLEK